MADQSGLNQFISLPVPATTPADGVAVDVSNLKPEKTWFVQGPFNGTYILEITHDDVKWIAIARTTNTGQDSEASIPFLATAKSARVRREAFAVGSSVPTMGLSSKVVCVCV